MNFIVYFFTFQLVYLCYAVALFGPIIFIFFLLHLIVPGFLFSLDAIIGIICLLLFALLVWFSHQTTKRIAYWHLSFTESFKETVKTFKSYIEIIFRYK